VDRGFDFLGLRIQRISRVGKTPCAYTFMSKAMFAATKRKVKALTRRHTRNLSLSELLMAINPVLRGMAYRPPPPIVLLFSLGDFDREATRPAESG
jgi:RNA-directed DNA polymerase